MHALTRDYHGQAEGFTPEDAQTLRLPDDQERARLQDPLARLEHGERDKKLAREEAVRMSHLREINNERYKDDYAANKALRRRLRCAWRALGTSVYWYLVSIWAP